MATSKNTPALGTKAAEIEMLREIMSLDGYLADSLPGDLDIMIKNINSDFPIFMGTSMDRSSELNDLQVKIDDLDERNIRLIREAKAKNNMIECISSDLEGMKEIKTGMILQAIRTNTLYLFEDFFTPNEVLRIKLEHNLELTDQERKALLARI